MKARMDYNNLKKHYHYKLVENKKTAIIKLIIAVLKWSHLESNQAPTDYESVALTE